jgi:hypothetical protein
MSDPDNYNRLSIRNNELQQHVASLTATNARIATLFDAVAHGDDEHRAWLREAIDAHFNGAAMPEVRGGSAKDALVASLTAQLAAKGEEVERLRPDAEKWRELMEATKLKAMVPQECDRCDGVGWHEGGMVLETTCQRCGGSGVIFPAASPPPPQKL